MTSNETTRPQSTGELDFMCSLDYCPPPVTSTKKMDDKDSVDVPF